MNQWSVTLISHELGEALLLLTADKWKPSFALAERLVVH